MTLLVNECGKFRASFQNSRPRGEWREGGGATAELCTVFVVLFTKKQMADRIIVIGPLKKQLMILKFSVCLFYMDLQCLYKN